MPFLNDEVREWIALELQNLGVEDLAVYALEAGTEGDERRVLVASEVGLLDHRYAPFGSSARYRLAMLLYPWQVLRGVELRADTFRLWAREHRTRWAFKLHHPHFEAATESPDLGQALCDFARVCAVMAEPFGVPAGKSGAGTPSGHAHASAPSADRAEAIAVGEPPMRETPTPTRQESVEPRMRIAQPPTRPIEAESSDDNGRGHAEAIDIPERPEGHRASADGRRSGIPPAADPAEEEVLLEPETE